MNKLLLTLHMSLLALCILTGCDINTPTLPSLDQESISYDQVLQKQQQLEQELKQTNKEQGE